MEKMRLALDELEVQSFTTSAAGEERGTVRGNESGTDPVDCGSDPGSWKCDPNSDGCGGFSEWACVSLFISRC
jgi:hypothetical protein